MDDSNLQRATAEHTGGLGKRPPEESLLVSSHGSSFQAQGLILASQGPGARGGEEEASQSPHSGPSLGLSAVTAPDLGFQTSRLAFLCFSSAKSHDSYQPCGVLVVGRRSNKAENLAHDGACVRVHFLSSGGIPGHRHPGPSTPGTGAPPLLRGRCGPARLQGSSFFRFLSLFLFEFSLRDAFHSVLCTGLPVGCPGVRQRATSWSLVT